MYDSVMASVVAAMILRSNCEVFTSETTLVANLFTSPQLAVTLTTTTHCTTKPDDNYYAPVIIVISINSSCVHLL